jgi:hypothetical protein
MATKKLISNVFSELGTSKFTSYMALNLLLGYGTQKIIEHGGPTNNFHNLENLVPLFLGTGVLIGSARRDKEELARYRIRTIEREKNTFTRNQQNYRENLIIRAVTSYTGAIIPYFVGRAIGKLF